MRETKFIIYGEPTGKGRPRFVGRYNSISGKVCGAAHTPEKTLIYENLVKMEYAAQTGKYRFQDDSMLKMVIEAYYSIPKSKSKKIREKMLSGEIRPTKKPDADNVMKIIADSLNEYAYHDDTQIVEATCRKFYSETPRCEVVISEIGGINDGREK